MVEAPPLSRKVVEIRVGECLALAGVVIVSLLHKTGSTARLEIKAPREVTIEKMNRTKCTTR